MTDDPIIEAATRALAGDYKSMNLKHAKRLSRCILPAVTPLIRNVALEEAAKEAEDCVTGEDAAYNIRLLKEQP